MYGRFEIDETLSGLTITTCEFQKADPTQFVNIDNDEELIAERDEDGNLPEISFAHLKEGSFLIDAGTKVDATTYRGIEISGIEYVGEAPDLGAYEYDGDIASSVKMISHRSDDQSISLFQAQNGVLFVTVNGPEGLGAYNAVLYNASGRIIGQHQFNGKTTAIRLPQGANGMVVLKVEGDNGFRGAVKAMVR